MGDIADAILNGDFDSVTGEWIGEGDGFPRTYTQGRHDSIPDGREPDSFYFKNSNHHLTGRWRGSKIHPIYNTILQLINVNKAAKHRCHNRSATLSFIKLYYLSKGEKITIGKKTKWKRFQPLITEEKKQFKEFIKNYTSENGKQLLHRYKQEKV